MCCGPRVREGYVRMRQELKHDMFKLLGQASAPGCQAKEASWMRTAAVPCAAAGCLLRGATSSSCTGRQTGVALTLISTDPCHGMQGLGPPLGRYTSPARWC